MRSLLALGVFVLYVVWGSFQERIKIDTNFLLDFSAQIADYDTLSPEERGAAIDRIAPDVPFDYYYSHPRVSGLLQLTRGQLGKFKWGFTLFAVALCLGVTWLILYLLYKARKWRRLTLVAFGGIFALGLGIYAFGAATGNLAEMYPASRKLIGAIQSPFAPALLAFLLRFGNFDSHERTEPLA